MRWRVRLEGSDGRVNYTQEIALEAGSRDIQYSLEFDWPASQGRLACRIPIGADSELRGGIPFGSERKDVDAEPYKSPDWDNMHRQWPGLFCAKDYVRAVSGQASAAILSVEGDRFFMLDRPRNALSYILINSVKMMENSWEDSVNRRGLVSVGPHKIRYAVRVGAMGELDRDAARAAQRLRMPVDCVLPYASLCEPSLPVHGSVLRIAEDNLALSAFYQDGEDQVLRFYETDGRAVRAHIDCPAEIRSCASENFIAQADGREVTLSGKQVALDVQPHEIVTLRMRFQLNHLMKKK